MPKPDAASDSAGPLLESMFEELLRGGAPADMRKQPLTDREFDALLGVLKGLQAPSDPRLDGE